jgi:intracellular sulfur oxidation DsrE/DsrF family protein
VRSAPPSTRLNNLSGRTKNGDIVANPTVLLFTHFGVGDGPADLQQKLAVKFLTLLGDTDPLPSQICFYKEGVKLVCLGSPALDPLRALEKKGVELIVCSTCLDYFGLTERREIGIVGGMPDILEAISRAGKLASI